VGSTLDVLVGIIYLLKNYDNICSTIDAQFIDNQELCKYYKNIGIDGRTNCEFMNFEAIWVFNKLHFSSNFHQNFKKCSTKKRFTILPLGIELKNASHANYLIYDSKFNEIERFEPFGSSAPYKFDYSYGLLDKLLEKKFKSIDTNIKYISPKDYMPKIGFQFYDSLETNRRKIGDPGGFCALWAIWYAEQRLIYCDISREKLVNKMIGAIKKQNMSFKNLIRNYSKNITNIRDEILKKAKVTINDILNDQLTENQVEIIINEIILFINKYNKL